MGLMNFLEKALNMAEEYRPQAEAYMEKVQKKVERENKQKREEIEREYAQKKDQELLDAYNSESSRARKTAIRELLEGRIEKYKKDYYHDSPRLLVDYLKQRTSPLEKKAIIALLEKKGYEKDSNNEWNRKQN